MSPRKISKIATSLGSQSNEVEETSEDLSIDNFQAEYEKNIESHFTEILRRNTIKNVQAMVRMETLHPRQSDEEKEK